MSVRAGVPIVLCAVLANVAGLTLARGSEAAAQNPVAPRVVARLRPPVSWAINHIAYMRGAQALVVVAAADSPIFLHGTLEVAFLNRAGGWAKLLDERRLACRPPILELLVPTAQTVESVAFTEGCSATTKRILSYSFKSRRIKQLYPYSLPFPAGPFVLLPGTTKGILNDGTGLEERLRWLTPTRLSAPIRLGLDRVGNLAISPDGERFAVSAVKGIGGVQGPERWVASDWFVRVSDTSLRRHVGRVPRVLFDENPYLSWSPDSTVLAAAGQTSQKDGVLILVRRSDLASIVVTRQRFGAIAWVDSHTLAIVRHRNYEGLGGDEVWLVDVRSALRALQ